MFFRATNLVLIWFMYSGVLFCHSLILTKAFEIVSKECYLLSMKELFHNKITKPHEVIVNKFLCFCVCFFLLVSMQ